MRTGRTSRPPAGRSVSQPAPPALAARRGTGRASAVLCLVAMLSFAAPGASALDIILTDAGNAAPGTPQRIAFERAAAFLESVLTDPISVRFDVRFAPIPGQPLSTRGLTETDPIASFYMPVAVFPQSADAIGAHLVSDATSIWDAVAVANLQPGIALDFVVNTLAGIEFDGNPTETGGEDVFIGQGGGNNIVVNATPALARALGVTNDAEGSPLPVGASDATITLNSDLTEVSGLPAWDFDPENGIDSLAVDFVGVAIHEMLHALGFQSGVDAAENLALGDPQGILIPACEPSFDGVGFIVCPHVQILDFFRFSDISLGLDPTPPFPCPDCGPGVLHVATGGDPFFSVDGGVTPIAPFASGATLGDGYNADHWTPADGVYYGVMQATSDRGVRQVVTVRDMLAVDVIGWDVAAPEPTGVWPWALLWMAGLAGRRRVPARRDPSLD